jgi:hypothetical protein
LKRFAVAALFLISGCQGDDSRYDAAAKAKARAVAPTIASYGKLVSVGQARERGECSEARPFVAGRCLDVVVSRDLPVIDRPGETVRVRTHVFVWLKRGDGRWAVRQTAQWSPDIVLTLEHPGGTQSTDVAMPPSWMYGGYVQEPLPGS